MAERRGFMARLKRFWQGLTGSGVRTYDEPGPAGAEDSRDQQPGTDTGLRNQLRGSAGM